MGWYSIVVIHLGIMRGYSVASVFSIFMFSILARSCSKELSSRVNLTYQSDAILNCMQLMSKYGYNGEAHTVTTADGYILEMHRITGPRSNPRAEGKPVIFLMHGLLCSSVDWIIAGPGKAFGYMLADEGYDVWMGNARGNYYSQGHTKYSTTDKEFWMFSWHDMGVQDLPAMIDYVRESTKRDKIFYAGHSQGNTAFFAMASEKPEYNEKIIALVALAPVAFCTNMKSPTVRWLARFRDFLQTSLAAIGVHGFDKSTNNSTRTFFSRLCPGVFSAGIICKNILFFLTGFGSDQVDSQLLPALLGHIPAGSSVRQLIHYGQLIRSKEFRQYDHGRFGNYQNYGQKTPPRYNISRITVPVILHYSLNDWLVSVKDVDRLAAVLPNVYAKLECKNPKFGHQDYLWGINASQLIHARTLSLLDHLKLT